MSKWAANFDTHSRDDVMKVCALLAKGIGADIISNKRIRIFVRGSFNSGKTAVTDGIVAALSDGMKSYNLPPEPLIEDFKGQAMHDEIVKEFQVNGSTSFVTLSRSRFAFARSSGFYKSFMEENDYPDTPGIDFMTTCYKKPPENADITIEFTDHHDSKIFGPEWDRNWIISIESQRLQTPQMLDVLGHLQDFHQRRQARRFTKEALSAEPS